MLANKKA